MESQHIIPENMADGTSLHFWYLWTERNSRCFDGVSTLVHILKARCLLNLSLLQALYCKKLQPFFFYFVSFLGYIKESQCTGVTLFSPGAELLVQGESIDTLRRKIILCRQVNCFILLCIYTIFLIPLAIPVHSG